MKKRRIQKSEMGRRRGGGVVSQKRPWMMFLPGTCSVPPAKAAPRASEEWFCEVGPHGSIAAVVEPLHMQGATGSPAVQPQLVCPERA